MVGVAGQPGDRPTAFGVRGRSHGGRVVDDWLQRAVLARPGLQHLDPGKCGPHLVHHVGGVVEPQRLHGVQPGQVLQQHAADHLVRYQQGSARSGTGDPGQRPACPGVGIGIALPSGEAIKVPVPRPGLGLPRPRRGRLGTCKTGQFPVIDLAELIQHPQRHSECGGEHGSRGPRPPQRAAEQRIDWFAADCCSIAAHLQHTFGRERRIEPALLPAFQIPHRLPMAGQVHKLEREHNPQSYQPQPGSPRLFPHRETSPEATGPGAPGNAPAGHDPRHGCPAVASGAGGSGMRLGQEACGPRERFAEGLSGELCPVLAVEAGLACDAALRKRQGEIAPPPGGGRRAEGGLDEVAGVCARPIWPRMNRRPAKDLSTALRAAGPGRRGRSCRPVGWWRFMAASTAVTHHTASVAAATTCGTSAAVASSSRRSALDIAATDQASVPSPAKASLSGGAALPVGGFRGRAAAGAPRRAARGYGCPPSRHVRHAGPRARPLPARATKMSPHRGTTRRRRSGPPPWTGRRR